eukprot:280829-Chlamydomonas_euryale.AAC.8
MYITRSGVEGMGVVGLCVYVGLGFWDEGGEVRQGTHECRAIRWWWISLHCAGTVKGGTLQGILCEGTSRQWTGRLAEHGAVPAATAAGQPAPPPAPWAPRTCAPQTTPTKPRQEGVLGVDPGAEVMYMVRARATARC